MLESSETSRATFRPRVTSPRASVFEGHGQLDGRDHGPVVLADPSEAALLLRLDVLELRE